jgi:membrane protease YdiL (CAAX protease family)
MPSTFAISWAVLLLVTAPIAGIVARRPLAPSGRPRVLLYAASAINLIVIGAITATIDLWRNGNSVRALTLLLPASHFVSWALGVLLLCIIISIGVLFVRAKLGHPPSSIVISFLPRTRIEKAAFLVLCLLVGIVEEFLFRGFAFFTLGDALQSQSVVIAIVTISFALQHGIQDAIGIGRAFILGAVLAVPVLVTGSLLPSIAAHAIVDAFTGLYGLAALESFRPR